MPGTAILPNGLLAVGYFFALVYLFLGISIVADIFMGAIEKITSEQVVVKVTDAYGDVTKEKKVPAWNATVANLTLMAFGSSAPEIILALLETVQNLGQCPGELGASTIVGSAAFNLLVISALCVYAVSEENDTDPDRDDSVPQGVKKIDDMLVFSITATSSLLAYIWIWIALMDQVVSTAEALITLAAFFVLIIISYFADKYTQSKKGDKEEEIPPFIEYSALEIYRELLAEKQGTARADAHEVEKRAKMKNFLTETLNTDKIEQVSLEDLKRQIEGEGMIKRI